MPTDNVPSSCAPQDHVNHQHTLRSDRVIKRTADMFRALGDPSRLRIIELLFDGKHCVTELAEEAGASMSIVSQRLKILSQAGIVQKARHGKHIYYSLADEHIVQIIYNSFQHTTEHNL